jgi:L-alanine-DL-glutamate epimerase-like enolase superfamily enzyme
MRLRLRRFPLTKAIPLAISRGSTSGVEHLLLELEHDGITGRGETGGFDTGHRHYDTGAIAAELETLRPRLERLKPQPLQTLEPLLAALSPPARCGLDLALHDWWGQRLGQPLHRLWGLDPDVCVATSVTLGLGEPAAVLAVGAALRPGDELQVDANGGWDLASAGAMIPWLAQQGVVLVEQPLAPQLEAAADTAGFAALKALAPIPLIADESCWDLADLLRLAPHVDGINIKLVKCGGLSEGLLMARTARRLGLGVMLGCYSDGGLLNGAAAQLLPLVQWPDLDSHLNLIDDPFDGPPRQGDLLRPSHRAGLGVTAIGPLDPPAAPPPSAPEMP